ncbi:MAG TPA: hypothetical protein VGM87_11490 [Roseomonas sp.]
MHRILMGACLLAGLVLQVPALAQPPGFPGEYAGQGEGELSLRLHRLAGNRYRADITTTDAGRCAGGVDGEAEITPDGHGVLRTANEEYDPNASTPWLRERYCTITFRIEGRSLRLEEGDGCLGFHGAACGFTGTLQRR